MTNVERLRPAYRSWSDSRGADPAVWLDLFDDATVFRSMANGLAGIDLGGGGLGAVRRYFAAVAQDWEMLSFVADDFIADGDRVVMVGRGSWRHRETGGTFESPIVHVWRFADGRALELLECVDTARALAAARGG